MSSNRLKKDVHDYMRTYGVRYQKARDAILAEHALFEAAVESGKPVPFRTADYAQEWARNEHTTDLIVPLGWSTAGKGFLSPNTFELNIASVTDGGTGPHGCIQGKTGSGKSHLINNIVTALCSRYSPSKVNILLMNFYGRGAVTENFPHIVGRKGYLNNRIEEVARISDAIDGEMEQRERLLRTERAKDITEYRAKRAKEPSLEPLPHLVVICDEFHDFMINNKPYLRLFNRITSKGRALGIHLLISDQFIDAGLLQDSMNHVTYGISFTSSTQAQSRAVLDGDPTATHLPLGSGDALVRHIDAKDQVNHVNAVRVFDRSSLSAILLRDRKAPVSALPFAKLPASGADEWIIGGDRKNPVRVPRNQNILVQGGDKYGKSTTVLSIIAASAVARNRGRDNSTWYVLSAGVTPLEYASDFPNVAAHLSFGDLGDAAKLDKLWTEVHRRAEGGEPQYVVLDDSIDLNPEIRDQIEYISRFPNVYTVEDGQVRGQVRDRFTITMGQAVGDGASVNGLCLTPNNHVWSQVSVPWAADDGTLREKVAVFATTLTKKPRVEPVFDGDGTVKFTDLTAADGELPIGVVPFTTDTVGIPLSVEHILVEGYPKYGTTEALRTCVQSLTAAYSSDQAQFVVADFGIELSDTVRHLIDGGYMTAEDYSVNAQEWQHRFIGLFALVSNRTPTRDTVLQGRKPNGKWYEGKDVFLVVANAAGILLGDIERLVGTLNTYDTGVHLVVSAHTMSNPVPGLTNSAVVSMSGAQNGPENRTVGRANIALPSGKEHTTQIAEPTV